VKRSRRKPLAGIVAVTLAIVTTAVLGTYSILSYVHFANKQRTSLHGLLALQARELAVALALPVWNIDRNGIDRVITAMAQPKSIYAIRVTAAGKTHGVIRNTNWTLVPWLGAQEPPGLLVQEAKITLGNNNLGTARILVTPRFMENDLHEERVRIVWSIATSTLLIILVIYAVLYRMFVQPVEQIEQYAMMVSKGGHGESAPLASGSASELVNLKSSLDTMITLLDQRYIELQEEMIRRFESEERFRTIFDSVNDTIIIYDPESGAILDVNARFCEVFGYTREEALQFFSGSFASGIGPYSAGFAREKIRGLGINEHFIMEWQARRRDGALTWFEISLRAAMIGGMRRVITVARDINHRKEMEEELRRRETMSAMGALVAGVAHEVRNPLFGIASTIDAFEAEFGSGEGATEYMSTLRTDVARLSRLMHDLLEYGRPRDIVKHVQSVEPAIAEAIRICSPRAKERQIEIQQMIDSPLPLAAVDAERIVTMLKNVIENAVEFSSAGQPVAITASAQRNGKANLVFTIADHGPGFRDAELPHVFEPFFTRRKGGSGLGLAIVQKVVTEHGGTVAAHNRANGGATIEIRLPASS